LPIIIYDSFFSSIGAPTVALLPYDSPYRFAVRQLLSVASYAGGLPPPLTIMIFYQNVDMSRMMGVAGGRRSARKRNYKGGFTGAVIRYPPFFLTGFIFKKS
jgi:hypothetical protein